MSKKKKVYLEMNVNDDYLHNKQAIEKLAGEIDEKHLFHQKKFHQFRKLNKFVVISTTLINSFSISSLAVFFLTLGNPIFVIISMSLSSVSFIISSVAMAFQLNDKLEREKSLAGQYYELHREIQKTLLLNEALIDKDFVVAFLDTITEKIEVLETFESTV